MPHWHPKWILCTSTRIIHRVKHITAFSVFGSGPSVTTQVTCAVSLPGLGSEPLSSLCRPLGSTQTEENLLRELKSHPEHCCVDLMHDNPTQYRYNFMCMSMIEPFSYPRSTLTPISHHHPFSTTHAVNNNYQGYLSKFDIYIYIYRYIDISITSLMRHVGSWNDQNNTFISITHEYQCGWMLM